MINNSLLDESLLTKNPLNLSDDYGFDIAEFENSIKTLINEHKILKEKLYNILSKYVIQYIGNLNLFKERDTKAPFDINNHSFKDFLMINKDKSSIFVQLYDLKVRKHLLMLIKIIRNPKTSPILTEQQEIKFNDQKNHEYNIKLEQDFDSFLNDFFACQNKDIYDEDILNMVTYDFYLAKNISTIKPANFYFNRKKNILIQIFNLFTENKVKRDCLTMLLSQIEVYEKQSKLKFEKFEEKNYIFEEKYYGNIEDKLLSYLQNEELFLISTKEWVKNEIKIVEPLIKDDPSLENNHPKPPLEEQTPNIPANSGSPKEKQISALIEEEKTNWLVIFSIAVAVLLIILLIGFLIMKFK